MERRLGLLVLQKSALENNFEFTENLNLDTVIVSFFKNYYCGEVLGLHLTTVKGYDFFDNSIVENIHLTLRSESRNVKSCSVYYELQHSRMKHFRFCRTEDVFNNQTDDMSEFLGQQGVYNFSSAVLQPVLSVLHELSNDNKLFLDRSCLKLRSFYM